MKKITFILIFAVTMVSAQKKIENLKEYKASNGVLYKVDDDITLNRGSDTNGRFVYVTIGGWGASINAEDNRLPATNSGLIVTVKKIKKVNKKRYKGVVFVVGGGNITNYYLEIENAIATCEVKPCEEKQNGVVIQESDKYDKLKKLKELLDSGVLTQEEFNQEKKKLLEQ